MGSCWQTSETVEPPLETACLLSGETPYLLDGTPEEGSLELLLAGAQGTRELGMSPPPQPRIPELEGAFVTTHFVLPPEKSQRQLLAAGKGCAPARTACAWHQPRHCQRWLSVAGKCLHRNIPAHACTSDTRRCRSPRPGRPPAPRPAPRRLPLRFSARVLGRWASGLSVCLSVCLSVWTPRLSLLSWSPCLSSSDSLCVYLSLRVSSSLTPWTRSVCLGLTGRCSVSLPLSQSVSPSPILSESFCFAP